jgi:hypothetical protein
MAGHLEEELVDAGTLGDVHEVHDVLDLFQGRGKKDGGGDERERESERMWGGCRNARGKQTLSSLRHEASTSKRPPSADGKNSRTRRLLRKGDEKKKKKNAPGRV